MKLPNGNEIEVYLDTCEMREIATAASNPHVDGLTTNPTLMRRAGVKNYLDFAKEVLLIFPKPVAFEVTSEEPIEVIRQAKFIQSWRSDVNVKIPCMTTGGQYNTALIKELMFMGVHVNITAIISLYQCSRILAALPNGRAILSVFAGRLADTGISPFDTMLELKRKLHHFPDKRVLWASVREAFNLHEAAACGCNIITMPPALLQKAIQFCEMDPEALSVETSKQFVEDSIAAGLTL